jgi:2-phosphosulfolactate phosphatase
MQIHVDLLPRSGYRDVVIVIDVLRTCTVAPVLFDRGLTELRLTPSLRVARQSAGGSALLIGERSGLPPEGFNYGNSPAELGNIDFGGRQAVLVSENAPAALPSTAGARHVLLGSLYNASAVADLAEQLAQERIDLVCCGFGGEEDLDDALAAGVIAADMSMRFPDATLTGASRFAMSLLHAYPDPIDALWQSVAGHYLRKLDLEQDIGMAARLSHSHVVPALESRTESGGGELFTFTPRRPD